MVIKSDIQICKSPHLRLIIRLSHLIMQETAMTRPVEKWKEN